MAKRITAVTGEYQNQQNEQKAEFTNIGIIGVSAQGKEYVLLDPSVSLSGVLAKQNALAAKRGGQPRDMIMCSVFDNDNQQQGSGQPQQQHQQQPQHQGNGQQQYHQPQQMQQQQSYQPQQYQGQQAQYNAPPADFDDDRR